MGLVKHEQENNKFLALLRTNDFEDVVKLLITNPNVVVFAPQSITIDYLKKLSRQFVETHVLLRNVRQQSQMVSLNGLCGTLTDSKSTFLILGDPLVEVEQISQFLVDRDCVFEWPVFTQPPMPSHTPRQIQILRVASVQLNDTVVPLYLTSSPLTYPGCDWDVPPPDPNTAADAIAAVVPDASVNAAGGAIAVAVATSAEGGAVAAPSTGGALSALVPKFIRDLGGARSRTVTAPSRPGAPGTFVGGKEASTIPNPLQAGGAPPPLALSKDAPDRQQEMEASETKFSDFLEKMRHPSAFELVKSIKGFINSFLESSIPPDEMGPRVHSFLSTTEATLQSHGLWKDASRSEMDSAVEGLEKYLMNKLYPKAFAPAGDVDMQRDGDYRRRLESLQFMQPAHLDIKEGFRNEKAFGLAASELSKLNNYKAPRDKLVCVLNCCKVIFNVLNAVSSEGSGADEFLPVLIYVVLRANAPHMRSNIEYISRFRNPKKMMSEAGYYFTHLMSAVSFLETVEASQLSMDPGEFEGHMAAFANREAQREEAERVASVSATATANAAAGSAALATAAAPTAATTATPTPTPVGSFWSTPVAATMSISTPSIPLIPAPAPTAGGVDIPPRSDSAGALLSLSPQRSTPVPSLGASGAQLLLPVLSGLDGKVDVASDGVGSRGQPPRSLRQDLLTGMDDVVAATNTDTGSTLRHKFASIDVQDLTMSDIPLLLEDYRRLLQEVALLSRPLG